MGTKSTMFNSTINGAQRVPDRNFPASLEPQGKMKKLIIVILSLGVGLSTMGGATDSAKGATKAPQAIEKQSLDSMVLKTVAPVYPREMRLAGVDGFVKLGLTVDERGNVVGVQIIKADQQAFAQAAVEALRKWQFVEAKGSPTKGERHVEVPVRFMLAAN